MTSTDRPALPFCSPIKYAHPTSPITAKNANIPVLVLNESDRIGFEAQLPKDPQIAPERLLYLALTATA